MKGRIKTGVAVAAFGAGALAAYVLGLRPWHLKWGATEEEARAPLPGDDLVPEAKGSATHAVTINAPVADVWPWLVQVGQDKGGFYSYSWLENLFGCRMRNADRIVPEFQGLKVGDTVWLHPKVPPLPVLVCEPFRAIVLGSNTKDPGTWGFYLKELDENTTRLIVRGRGNWQPGLLKSFFYFGVFEPAHFIMERKMMLEIKRLAEAKQRADSDVPVRQGLDMIWSGRGITPEGPGPTFGPTP
jgi:hypothetical protein